jgi:hypothetical protein
MEHDLLTPSLHALPVTGEPALQIVLASGNHPARRGTSTE